MTDIYIDDVLIGEIVKEIKKDENKDLGIGTFVIACSDDCIGLLRAVYDKPEKISLIFDYKDGTKDTVDAICSSLYINSDKTVELDFAFRSDVKEINV